MSSLRFSLIVALRYLWSQRAEAFITIITIVSVIGVAIGVMVLNMVMSIMTGFEVELREKIVGANSHILVRGLDGKISKWRELKEKIEEIEGVNAATPYSYNQALLRAGARSSGVLVRGITPSGPGADQLDAYMTEVRANQGGGVERLKDPPSVIVPDGNDPEKTRKVQLPAIIIGAELQRSLRVFIGEPVSMLSPNVTASPFGLVPRYRRFVVAGIYSSGLVEYESSLVYTTLAAGQHFFELGDAVSGLEVRVEDIDNAPLVSRKIQSLVSEIGESVYSQDWTVTNKALWEALRLEKKVYFIVLLLIVVMASFSIITTLIMIVLEKRRDIAVLRTMGASVGSIARIFQIQGVVIGGLGTVGGTILGYLGCAALREYGFPLNQNVFPVSTVPVHMEPLNFFIVAVSAFSICMLATLYPARRASRVDPGLALRYE